MEVNYQSIFESLNDSYLVLDCDLRIVAASDNYLRSTMVSRESIIGKIIFDAFPDNPSDPHATGVTNLKNSLQSVLKYKKADLMAVQQYDIRRPADQGGDFEVRYWSALNSPVLDENHQVKYIVHRVEDITKYIALQKTGQAHQKEIEKWRDRAGKMETQIYMHVQKIQKINKELKQANENLALMNEIKTKFFANVSHELRTPLTLILGPINALVEDPTFPATFRNNVILVQQNARLLLKHVNDLLEIAKLEAGKMPLHYSNVNVVSLIQKTMELFTNVIEKKKIHCILSVEEPLDIQADGEKLQRILVNLISNALKYTPENGSLKITAKKEAKFFLQIEDSGPGIPVSLRKVIFERFYQVEKSSTRVFGGTGLGLSIVKDLVILHGGQIMADVSELGGASFTILLPFMAPAGVNITAQEYDPRISAIEANIGMPKEHKPLVPAYSQIEDRPTVLVVEDSPEMNNYICETLEGIYNIQSAFNGEEGLQQARAHPPDLIISDIMMPKMDGETMVREIRKNNLLLHVPILVLTARADDSLCVQMLREGAQEYMTKPFVAEELKARIANLIAMKKAEDELERFVYLTSHDLKSPLPAIDHLVSWVEEDTTSTLSKQSKVYLSTLRKRALRMANLLDGLVRYSQAGNLYSDPVEINFESFVNTLVEQIEGAKNFSIEFQAKVKNIVVALLPFQEVMNVLITNSIKHNRYGKGKVIIGIEEYPRYYEVFVEDDGPGIEAKYHKKIFELFQRLQSRDILESSGVGLSIAKKIVESKGGTIGIDTKKISGTTFRFTWPKWETENGQ